MPQSNNHATVFLFEGEFIGDVEEVFLFDDWN